MARDPAGLVDGPNLYAYVHNGPTFLFDRWGMESNPDSSYPAWWWARYGPLLGQTASSAWNSVVNTLGSVADAGINSLIAGAAIASWAEGVALETIGESPQRLYQQSENLWNNMSPFGRLQAYDTNSYASQVTMAATFFLPGGLMKKTKDMTGVVSYTAASRLTQGFRGEIQAHHLIEQRHLLNWGFNPSIIDESPSVILVRRQHEQLNQLLEAKLPVGQIYSPEQVMVVYRDVYKNFPEWTKAIENWFKAFNK